MPKYDVAVTVYIAVEARNEQSAVDRGWSFAHRLPSIGIALRQADASTVTGAYVAAVEVVHNEREEQE